MSLIRFYSLCKIKWILDYKFVPVTVVFLIYNFVGVIILLISNLISSYIKCIDKTKINDIDLICFIKIDNEYYFDSFSYYFKQLWRNDRNIGMNLLYLFLFLIQLFLNALRLLFTFLIIKHLNPEYYLCSFGIYFFIVRLICLIDAIINKGDIKTNIYDLFVDVGSLIGVMIYLELIELKVYNLNQNLKKNIEMRSITESGYFNLLDNESENFEN